MKVVKTLFLRRLISTLAAAPFFVASAFATTPSVVIDVASGQILEQEQPTASWYPASLTKLMTAYVALDAVRQGKITLDTPLLVSPRATKMAPSKMGFRAGSQVTLRNALVMLMVKSANDIAVTIAEGVSGSVEAFADDMNRASARLGMRESFWANPNGLPDSRQVTSARDLAVLGRALLTQFPEQAGLFNIGAMQLGRSIHPTHNGLLGRYPGADGMKTGFTCPAGFNLVASATRGGRKLIAVVLGAPTAAARTAKAAALLDRGFTTGGSMGSIESLDSIGVGQAPDMRETVCHRRGKATAEFMAEIEDVPIAIGGGGTGVPLLDAMAAGGQQQSVSAKQIAQLPKPHFEPVQVYVGPAPGYTGPVARTRAAGAPIGEQPDLTAYTEEKPEAPAAGASPISRPATDARALRGRAARHGKAKAAHGKKIESAAPASIVAEEKTDAPTASGTSEKHKGKAAAAKAKPAKGKAQRAAAAQGDAGKTGTGKGKAGAGKTGKPAAEKSGSGKASGDAKQQ